MVGPHCCVADSNRKALRRGDRGPAQGAHLPALLDLGDGHGDLAGHKDLAAPRGLVVEQDAIAGEQSYASLHHTRLTTDKALP